MYLKRWEEQQVLEDERKSREGKVGTEILTGIGKKKNYMSPIRQDTRIIMRKSL